MHAATTVAISAAIFLTAVLSAANAHSEGLDASTCANFIVSHGPNSKEDDSKEVTLELINEDGEITDCIVPRQEYTVRLNANGFIKGYLLQAVTGARFPSKNHDVEIPYDATKGPCNNSISHTQARVEGSPDLIFPLRTLKNVASLNFRYSVVFSRTSFVQDKTKAFPCCESTNEPVTNVTNKTVIPENCTMVNDTIVGKNSTEPTYITLRPLGIKVDGNCGKKIAMLNQCFNHTVNNISYHCAIKQPLRQIQCIESCNLDGQEVVCQVSRLVTKRKGYICTAYEGQDMVDGYKESFTKKREETLSRGCDCFVPDSP